MHVDWGLNFDYYVKVSDVFRGKKKATLETNGFTEYTKGHENKFTIILQT